MHRLPDSFLCFVLCIDENMKNDDYYVAKSIVSLDLVFAEPITLSPWGSGLHHGNGRLS